MGRSAPGKYSVGWKAPDYEVDENGKIAGLVNDRQPNNWGRWGDLDERGTTNLLTPERVQAAAGLVSEGRIISMAIPLDSTGPVHPSRPAIQHWYGYSGSDMIVGTKLHEHYPGFQGTDDYLSMPLQGSTQWDGLAHLGYQDSLYNGFWIGNVEQFAGAQKCSIHHQKESLCGRGVLLDVARLKGVDHLEQGYAITPADLDEAVAAHGVEVGQGDILIIRTGNVAWWYTLTDKSVYFSGGSPGLSIACTEWLAEKDVAAVAMDNVAIEVEPFEEPYEHPYPMHARLIRDMGLSLGEIWHLEAISEACAAQGRYEFFVAAQPLNITNASGSPLNPIAIL
jgi:kynurenine formamidase